MSSSHAKPVHSSPESPPSFSLPPLMLVQSSSSSSSSLDRLIRLFRPVGLVHFRFPPIFTFPFAFAASYLCFPLMYWRRICPVAQSSSNLARYGSASLACLTSAHSTMLRHALTARINLDSLVID